MAKKRQSKAAPAKRASKAVAAAVPEHSAYALKGMNRELWSAFVARAKREGRTVRWLLDSFIAHYASGAPLNLAGEADTP
jgi:hypothetical protein